MPDFDNQTLAALRGRMVRYLMRSREARLFSETVVAEKQNFCSEGIHEECETKFFLLFMFYRLHWAEQPRTNP